MNKEREPAYTNSNRTDHAMYTCASSRMFWNTKIFTHYYHIHSISIDKGKGGIGNGCRTNRESIRVAVQETPPAHHTHYGISAESKDCVKNAI